MAKCPKLHVQCKSRKNCQLHNHCDSTLYLVATSIKQPQPTSCYSKELWNKNIVLLFENNTVAPPVQFGGP